MRELTVAEIEVVSGAGWADLFGGGITEQITKVIDFLNAAFSTHISPNFTPEQIKTAADVCKTGIAGMSLSQTGASLTATLSAVNGASMTITHASGVISFSCNPPK